MGSRLAGSCRIRRSAGALGLAAVAWSAAAGCAADEPIAEPPLATTAAASSDVLRYCLAPDLGDARPIVVQLLAELAATDDALALAHVAELDATCHHGLDGVDFAVTAWNAGACGDTLDAHACMVRSLLVDLEDLGESTAAAGDPDVVDELRSQLALMIDLGLGAVPPAAPPTLTVEGASFGCGPVMIGPIVPAAPTSYQAVTLAGLAPVMPGCAPQSYAWYSSLQGFLGWGTPLTVQLDAGTHVITYVVTVACPQADPDLPWILYQCDGDLSLPVAQGQLTGGPFCERDGAWWDAQAAAGLVHIQDERASSITVLTGTALPDLLLGNDRPNKINGKRHGDCLYGHGDRDAIAGHAGNDTIFGGDGGDLIHGHDDQDRAWGERGDDRIRGGSGGDYLVAGDGNDDVDGNWDRDTIFGDAGDDRLLGGWDDDTIHGGTGQDCVRGDVGYDWLYGDDGDDIVDGELGNDRLYGGAGADRLSGGWDDDDVYGGPGNDDLWGDAGDDDLRGEDDDDRLCGGVGSDDKDGGAHVNGDACQQGGTNAACESTPLWCPLASFPSC